MRSDMPATATVYVSKLLGKIKEKSKADKYFAAQHLVKSCMQYRSLHKAEFIKQFHHLRTSVLAVLSKAAETTSESQIHDILCGQGFHTSRTESYFPETMYNDSAFDKDGKVLKHKFPLYKVSASGSGTETWTCSSELCCIPSKSKVNQAICETYTKIAECEPLEARHFIQHMDDCTQAYMHDTKLLGHNKVCHLDPNACGSKLLYLCRLAPHYPNLRRTIYMLYSVRRSDSKISAVDRALQRGNLDALQEIIKEHRESKLHFGVSCETLDESKIREQYKKAISAFTKRNIEHAEYPCVSCTQLCFKRDCRQLDRLETPVTGKAWQQLMNHIESNPTIDDGLPTGYICDFCLGKFCAGLLPSRCILNGLVFETIPKEIAQLNQYEKVLIQ